MDPMNQARKILPKNILWTVRQKYLKSMIILGLRFKTEIIISKKNVEKKLMKVITIGTR